VKRKKGTFVLASGDEVRFWGVNCGPGLVRQDPGSVDYLARRLAKLGVNLVRIHGPLFTDDPTRVDEAYLAQLHYFVGAMKREGIYSTLSFYFPLWMPPRGKPPFARIFFDETLQATYRGWLKTLLEANNPYTKRPLGKDPAVAWIELVNEDSYLFWTFKPGDTIPAAQTKDLEVRFGEWLQRRYGSLGKALVAWGGDSRPRDAPEAKRMELLPAWHMTGQGHGRGGRKRRMSDQLRFLVEGQRAFYASTARYLKKDLACESLVSCGNWKTADPRVLGALERYTYTAGDIIDRHGYFGGEHKGDGASYSVRVGHTFTNRAGVLEPAALPLAFQQIADLPHVISEIGWPNPNRYKAEFPVLASWYGSLQGIDGFCLFAVGSTDWNASSPKFPVMLPSIAGQFPAAALMYRRGDVAEGAPVVHEVLDLEALFDFQGSAALEAQNLDQLRRAGVPSGGVKRGVPVAAVDPLAFFAGPVVRSFGTARARQLVRDLSLFIDRTQKVVRSVTGELAWDYGKGHVTVNTANAQGVVGFLAQAGTLELADVIIESENEFGAVLVVSLDDRPIARSKKLLIQAMTEDRPYGWRTKGRRVEDLGGYPLNVREVRCRVRLKLPRARLGTVHVLDAHGYERFRGKLGRGGSIQLARDSMYSIVD